MLHGQGFFVSEMHTKWFEGTVVQEGSNVFLREGIILFQSLSTPGTPGRAQLIVRRLDYHVRQTVSSEIGNSRSLKSIYQWHPRKPRPDADKF